MTSPSSSESSRSILPTVSVHKLVGPSGIETKDLVHRVSGPIAARITCIDYSPDQVNVEEVSNLKEFLSRHRPEWTKVRWINIAGLEQLDVIRAVAEKYQLHPLAVEDVLHTDQRAKAEDYPESADGPGRLFIVVRVLGMRETHCTSEQLSIFLGRQTLITFQETPGDGYYSIRQRLAMKGSRLREHDASFLLHALLDAVVDRYFPMLEALSTRLEEVEEKILTQPTNDLLAEVYGIKREMVLLRRTSWPLRDLIAHLQRDKHECLSEIARTYFRDIQDHCVQIIDLIETYREITSALAETYMSSLSNRMNQIMKVLTVISTIFIPLTFLAGVYGMNMPIPENASAWSYPLFWTFCILTAAGMIYFFKRQDWI